MTSNRLLKKSFTVSGEGGIVAIIEGQLNFESTVVLQLGRSAAGDLVTLVKAAPAKEDDAPPVFELGSGVDRAKGKLGPALSTDLEMGWSGEIEIIAIPQIGRDDPPAPDHFATGRAAHAAPTSFGTRTRL